jgi:replicative DNA helicase
MSVGLNLCAQVLSEHPALTFMDDFGLDKEDFRPDEWRVLECIKNHIHAYGRFPTYQTVEAECNVILPVGSVEPLSYWIDAVRRRSTLVIIQQGSERLLHLPPHTKLETYVEIVKTLGRDVDKKFYGAKTIEWSQAAEEVASAHDAARDRVEDVTIPFGFPSLDDMSGGLQGGDFVALMGLTGTGKTYIMLRMAIAAFLFGKNPMIITTEMTKVQVMRRIVALLSNLPATRIRKGQLSTHIGQPILRELLESLEHSEVPGLIMEASLRTSIDEVVEAIRDRDPDSVYLDGPYLLRPPRGVMQSRYEQVSSGAETFKLLAQELNKPITGTYQTKKGTDDVYMSKVIQQIASIVLQVEDVSEEEQGVEDLWPRRYKRVSLTKGREGESGTLTLSYDMGRMEIEELVTTGTEFPEELE